MPWGAPSWARAKAPAPKRSPTPTAIFRRLRRAEQLVEELREAYELAVRAELARANGEPEPKAKKARPKAKKKVRRARVR